MKRNSGNSHAVTSIHQLLRISPVRRGQHFSFNLFEFRFFFDDEQGRATLFGNPRILSGLAVAPYVLAGEAVLSGAKRYFVESGGCVVGVFAIHEAHDSLFIRSLAVAKEYRRSGVAAFVLGYVEKLADRGGKKWLRLSVLKKNTPAQRLYAKSGFTLESERKWSFVLKKKIGLS